jgi:hypothetical protein
MERYIYMLTEHGNPFYIGYTNSLETRIRAHRKAFGKHIEIEQLDKVEKVKYWEKFYIDLFRQWGFELRNKNNGGGGMVNASDETKHLMSITRMGKKDTLETRKNKSMAAKGKKFKDEHKRKLSESKIGISKPAISEGLKAKYASMSDEEREQWAEAKREGIKNRVMPSKYSKSATHPINQYDLEGNFIKQWKNGAEINRELGIDDGQLSKHMKKLQTIETYNGMCGGYRWVKACDDNDNKSSDE